MKIEYKKYMVVDRADKKILGDYDTFQDAWEAWQNCWMGKDPRYPIRYHSERFGVGQTKNMLRSIKPVKIYTLEEMIAIKNKRDKK
jgi:hypothetical protein